MTMMMWIIAAARVMRITFENRDWIMKSKSAIVNTIMSVIRNPYIITICTTLIMPSMYMCVCLFVNKFAHMWLRDTLFCGNNKNNRIHYNNQQLSYNNSSFVFRLFVTHLWMDPHIYEYIYECVRNYGYIIYNVRIWTLLLLLLSFICVQSFFSSF